MLSRKYAYPCGKQQAGVAKNKNTKQVSSQTTIRGSRYGKTVYCGHTSGESLLWQIGSSDLELISQLIRQGNTAFPRVEILKKSKSRKKKHGKQKGCATIELHTLLLYDII